MKLRTRFRKNLMVAKWRCSSRWPSDAQRRLRRVMLNAHRLCLDSLRDRLYMALERS